MAEKKIDQTKEEILKEFNEVKEELGTKDEIIHEIDEVKEDIVEMKEDLIEEIKADDEKDEKRNCWDALGVRNKEKKSLKKTL